MKPTKSALKSVGIFCICLVTLLFVFRLSEGMAEDKVVISLIEDLSGAWAVEGGVWGRGIAMAVEDVGGKVLGKPVEVVTRDDELKPDVAVRKFREVVEQYHPVVVISGSMSAVQLAMQQVAAETKTLFWTGGWADDLTRAGTVNRYTFRWTANDYAKANSSIPFFIEKNPKVKTFYHITSDYVWGRGMFDAGKQVIEKMGGKVVGNILTPLAEVDYSGAVTAALSANADAVVLNQYGNPLVKCARTVHEFGLKNKSKILLPGCSLDLIRGIGAEALEGMFAGQDWYHTVDNKFSREFVSRYVKKYKESPSYVVMIAYMSAKLTLDAIKRTGSTDPNKVICALEGYKYEGPTGPETIQGFDHQVNKKWLLGVGKSPKEMKDPDDFLTIIGGLARFETHQENPVVWNLTLPCDKK